MKVIMGKKFVGVTFKHKNGQMACMGVGSKTAAMRKVGA